ncbi:MAG: ATP synthase beta subunit C-terminal domain-containing protein, partial [Planctomycetota bacterium]
SDSVVQATLHVVKVFWSLKAELAYQRHFPAIDWLTSYSFYTQYLKESFEDPEEGLQFQALTSQAMSLLEQESELREIVRLVGAEALSPKDRLALEVSRSVREDFLHQNAFHKVDTYTSVKKQLEMIKTVLHFQKCGLEAINAGVETDDIFRLAVREDIARAKYIPEEKVEEIKQIRNTIEHQMKDLQTSPVA